MDHTPPHTNLLSLVSILSTAMKMAYWNLERKLHCGTLSLQTPVLLSLLLLMLGEMPSPMALVTMYGLSTTWLEAPETRLTVPPFLQSGANAPIPGTLTFRIKRPDNVHEGAANTAADIFQLCGHMSKIERAIPNFHLPRNIILQHPLEISKPKYLRCLAPGKEATVMWTVDS